MFIGSLIEANEYYENGQSKLRSGDRIFLYTDGLIEHKNSRGEEFGLHRLIDLVKIYKNLSLNEAVDTIVSHLKNSWVPHRFGMISVSLRLNWSPFGQNS
ncbi:MAG: SpoIIE family protein phosphatase [Leptospiraceae bacterium]|nr:SpoIIE family protein phosphatase [Leptospiraceae bacterium]